MSTKVAILHKTGDILNSLLAPDFPDIEFSVVPVISEAKTLPPEAEPLLPEADAIISIGRWMTPEVLAKCKRLRWFQCILTGVDHLVGPLAGSKVMLTNARGIHGPQMAELTLLHMMAAYRQVPALVKNQANHVWDRIRPRVLNNRTAVILGVGLIAEHVARLCKALGMRTIGISRTPRTVAGFDRIEPRDNLLKTVGEADFVVVLVPLTPENEKLVSAEVLAAMRPSAYLINVARGKVVDEEALIKAINSGTIAGAGVDVFERLPLPPDSPLWDMENVFVTPHLGGQSDQYEENLISILKPNLTAFLAGREREMINIIPLA